MACTALTPDGTLHPLVDDLRRRTVCLPLTSRSCTSTIQPTSISGRLTCADGTLTNSRIPLDMASEDPGVPDGFKVDLQGNVFCTGPGGVWVCCANGELLGRIIHRSCPRTWPGGEDGSAPFPARASVTGCQPRRTAR
jgi:sugar lactone lactonase YvrE